MLATDGDSLYLCICFAGAVVPQQEGYELLETHDFQGAIVIVDYLVKTMMGNLQVSAGGQQQPQHAGDSVQKE